MANIVVFGKPRAFESYEYIFDGGNASVENAHREPILKPKQYQVPVLHYFARKGYAGIEYYTRAKGFESERDGIVFGISLKSITDFSIFDTISNVLLPFWEDFAGALLDDNNKFIEDSILERLKSTQWSQSEIDEIQSSSISLPISSPSKGIMLLVSPTLDDIKLVEHSIKEYEDVYISDNPAIFKDSINDIVLKEAENQIFEIHNGKIVPYTEVKTPEQILPNSQTSVFGRVARLPLWGKRQNIIQETEALSQETTGDVTKLRKIVAIICFAIALVVLISALVWYRTNDNKGEFANQTKEEQHAGTEQPEEESAIDFSGITVEMTPCNEAIKNSWTLKPKRLPENCTKCYLSDLTFEVSHQSLVHIDQDYKLIVDHRPKKNTEIIVKAFLNTSLLGMQTYTIAGTENEGKREPVDDLLAYRGKPRSVKQYLKDRKNDLNNGRVSKEKVIEECQLIINSNKYNNNNDAILLRDSLKRIGEQSAF